MDVLYSNGARQLLQGVGGGDYVVTPADLVRYEIQSIAWPAARPTFWDNFDRADGAIGTAPSGQVYTQEDSADPDVTQSTIASDALTTPSSGNVDTFGYNFIDLGAAPSRMYAKISWPTTAGADMTMIANAGGMTKGDIIDGSVHILFNSTGVSLQVFDSGIQTLASKAYGQTLATGTTYTVGWSIEGETLTVQLPDGRLFSHSDPRFASLNGRYLCFECSYTNVQATGLFHYIEAA